MHSGLLLAVADRLQLRLGGAERPQVVGDRVRAAVAERQVVLLGAALVGVALDGDVQLVIGLEAARGALEAVVVGGRDVALVEGEVHAH